MKVARHEPDEASQSVCQWDSVVVPAVSEKLRGEGRSVKLTGMWPRPPCRVRSAVPLASGSMLRGNDCLMRPCLVVMAKELPSASRWTGFHDPAVLARLARTFVSGP